MHIQKSTIVVYLATFHQWGNMRRTADVKENKHFKYLNKNTPCCFYVFTEIESEKSKKSCTKKSRSCICVWKWCKSVRANEEMHLCVCVCVCVCVRAFVCIAGLMSRTVCLPPTALSEPAVIQTDSCISSLSLRHSRTPPTSPRLQQRTRKKKKMARTRKQQPRPRSTEARKRPHMALDGGNERAVLKFELFLLWRFGVSHPFSPPLPPENDVHQRQAPEPRVKTLWLRGWHRERAINYLRAFCSATIPQTTRNGL